MHDSTRHAATSVLEALLSCHDKAASLLFQYWPAGLLDDADINEQRLDLAESLVNCLRCATPELYGQLRPQIPYANPFMWLAMKSNPSLKTFSMYTDLCSVEDTLPPSPPLAHRRGRCHPGGCFFVKMK